MTNKPTTRLTILAIALGGVGLVAGVAGSIAEIRYGGAIAGLAALGMVLIVILQPRTSMVSSQFEAPALASMTVMPSNEPVSNELTGLFNEKYFRATVDTRVLAAKRHLRPVSVALVAVSDGPLRSNMADMVKVSQAVRTTLRDSDIACHLDDGRLAFILEDTPEDGAVWTLERLRRTINEIDTNFVQWAGIACYPAHAFNAGELMAKAEEALQAAWEWPQARIEVASAS